MGDGLFREPVEILFVDGPGLQVGFRFHVKAYWLTGQQRNHAHDIPFAAVVHGVKPVLVFHQFQTRT